MTGDVDELIKFSVPSVDLEDLPVDGSFVEITANEIDITFTMIRPGIDYSTLAEINIVDDTDNIDRVDISYLPVEDTSSPVDILNRPSGVTKIDDLPNVVQIIVKLVAKVEANPMRVEIAIFYCDHYVGEFSLIFSVNFLSCTC